MADAGLVGGKKREAPAYLIPPSIAKALVAIQAELEPLAKTAENDAFNSTYAPLEEITVKAHRLLADRDIAVLQPPVTDEQGHAALETILVHKSGQSFSRTTKLAMNRIDPQAHGSAITYTRRYALMAMIGLTAKGEDDDGNKATGVHAPVTDDQISEVKTLLKHLKWPQKQIASEVFNLKTRDAAALAIANYQALVSQKVRDDESKANASAIEAATPDGSDEAPEDVASTSLEGFKRRVAALGLANADYERKVFVAATKAYSLAKIVESEEKTKNLNDFLIALESGMHALEPEFYAPTKEPRTVEVAVA